MMNERKKIEALLGRFLEGQTSEAEEHALAEYFSCNDNIPEEWTVYKEMFDSFKTDSYDFSEEEMEAMLTPAPSRKMTILYLWPWVSAACVAAIAVLVALNPWQKVPVADDSSTVAHVEKVETSFSATIKEQVKSSGQEAALTSVVQDTQPAKLTKKKKRSATANRHHLVSDALGEIDELMLAVTTSDEQVESYDVRMIGDGKVVTKHLEDGSSHSYIILTSAEDNERTIIPMTTNL